MVAFVAHVEDIVRVSFARSRLVAALGVKFAPTKAGSAYLRVAVPVQLFGGVVVDTEYV